MSIFRRSISAGFKRNGGEDFQKRRDPLVVSRNEQIAGVIHLKDVVKGGIKERFMHLRKMGIKTVMITGDNALTAAAIAAESGVDDFLAEATPEDKLKLIRDYQAKGEMVAMAGTGPMMRLPWPRRMWRWR